jgi:hypothetical protein
MIVYPMSFIKESGPTPVPDPTLYFDIGDPDSYPGSGTTITDLSGNGNNGTLSGDWSYSSSDGGTIVMGGTNSLALVTQNSSINFSNISSPISIVIWVKINSGYSAGDGIWNKEFNAPSYDGIRLLAYTSDAFYLGVNGFSADSKGPSSSNAFTTGTWTMVTTVIVGGTSKIYVDNNSTPVLSLSTPSQSLTATANLEIGREFNGGGSYLAMSWGQFRYYKGKSLSTQNISDLFDADKARYGL